MKREKPIMKDPIEQIEIIVTELKNHGISKQNYPWIDTIFEILEKTDQAEYNKELFIMNELLIFSKL